MRGELHLLVIPDGPDAHGLPLQLLEQGGHFLNGIHLGGVDMGDDVPLLQPAVLGWVHIAGVRGYLRSTHHHNAIGEELDTHGTAHRNDRVRDGGITANRHQRQHQQKDCCHRPAPWSAFLVQSVSPAFLLF